MKKTLKKRNANRKKYLNMKGCSKKMRGGSGLPPLPPPFVGSAWTPNPSTWPGTSTNAGNHFALNNYNNQMDRFFQNEAWNPPFNNVSSNDFKLNPKQMGGKVKRSKREKKTKKQRGGLLGMSVFNQMGTDLTNAYNTWQGKPQDVSPLPFKDQIYYGRRAEQNINSIIF